MCMCNSVTKETPAAQDMIVEFSGHKACGKTSPPELQEMSMYIFMLLLNSAF